MVICHVLKFNIEKDLAVSAIYAGAGLRLHQGQNALQVSIFRSDQVTTRQFCAPAQVCSEASLPMYFPTRIV